MDAAQALADLTEVSSQIEGAVFVEANGKLLASTFPGERGAAVGAAAVGLLRSAEASPASGDRAALTQVVASLPTGAVFVVRSGERLVAAVTGRDPTVGLILYDLKTCLRLAEEEAEASKPKRRRSASRTKAKPGAGSAKRPKKGSDA